MPSNSVGSDPAGTQRIMKALQRTHLTAGLLPPSRKRYARSRTFRAVSVVPDAVVRFRLSFTEALVLQHFS